MLYDSKSEVEWVQSDSGLIIPSDCRPKPRPKGFDFFAGCGGMSLGMHQAGIHVVGAMEFDKFAAQTYLTNLAHYGQCKIHYDTDKREADFEKHLSKEFKRHEKDYGVIGCVGGLMGSGWISQHPDEPGCEHFWLADVRNITGEMILKELGMKVGELDVVAGGPPCQGFSRAGKQDVYDPRNVLVFEYARLIGELQPKTFIFENVPGILDMVTPDGIPVMDEFCSIIADGGYSTYENIRKMLGLNPKARRVVRQSINKKEAYKNKGEGLKPKKPLASAAKVSPQPALFR
jgi:DNA (cytosine-5)-methyltransferase 1